MERNRPDFKACEAITEEIKDLPTLPTVVARIMATLDDPSSSVKDLERLVSSDQAIAAKLLKLANSAFYGLPGKVTNLGRAITLLGYNTVRSMTLTIGMVHSFGGLLRSKSFNRGKFWEHSLTVAMVGKLLGAKEPSLNSEEVYIAGLLHDLGKMVLDYLRPAQFREALRIACEQGISAREAEQSVLGFSHDEVGKVVAEKWRFPHFVIEAIGYHHCPFNAEVFPLVVQVVSLSDQIVHEFNKQEKENVDYNLSNIDSELKQRFLPTPRHEEVFLTQFEIEVEKIEDILGLFA